MPHGFSAGLLFVLHATTALFASDWPQYRGQHYDGISREKDAVGTWPDGQPRREWKASVGVGFSGVTVANGRVYTAGSDGLKKGGKDTVYCLDAATGKQAWAFSYPQDLDPKYYEGGPGATPTVAGGRVFMVGRHGLVHALDAASGRVIWARNIAKELGLAVPDWGFNGSAVVRDDTVYLNAGSAGIALDKETGKERWVTGKDECGYGTPVPFEQGGRPLLAMFGAKHVLAVEPGTGREAWRVPWKTDWNVNASDPVVAGDRMFVSSGYGTGCAVYDLSTPSPRRLWANKEIRSQMASVVVMGRHVYGVDGQGGDKDSRLKCLDLETGALKWTSPASETGNLAAVGDRLIWLTGTGELVVVQAVPDGYRELARAQVSGGKHWTAPVIANGRLFVRNARGDVVCLDVKGSTPG